MTTSFDLNAPSVQLKSQINISETKSYDIGPLLVKRGLLSVTLPTVSELERTPIGELIQGDTLLLGGYKIDLVQASKDTTLPYNLSRTPQGVVIAAIACFFYLFGEEELQRSQTYSIRDRLHWRAGLDYTPCFTFRRVSTMVQLMAAREWENRDFNETELLAEWKDILAKSKSVRSYGHWTDHVRLEEEWKASTTRQKKVPQVVQWPPCKATEVAKDILEWQLVLAKHEQQRREDSSCAIL